MLKPVDTSRWSRQDIMREAQMQSAAIARLDTWKRLAFSLTAVGAILVIWGHGSSIMPGMVAGIICLVLGIPASVVLAVGVKHAKVNVKNMLNAAGVDVQELLRPRGKRATEGNRGPDADSSWGGRSGSTSVDSSRG